MRTRLVIGLGVSGVIVLLLLRAVDPHALGAAILAADFRLVSPAIALYFLGVWVRTLRWGLLLPPGAVPPEMLFRVLVVGFTVNNVLPARLGELARAYLLARWRGVAYGTTLASVVLERILDGITLAALLLVGVLLIPSPGYLLALGLAVGGAFCAGAGLLVLAAWRSDAIGVLARLVARPLPRRVGATLERLATRFAQGVRQVRGGRLLGRLALLSLLGWLLEMGMFYVLMLAFPLPASLPLALLSGSAANFATLVPSSPGYVGTFDGALAGVLVDAAGVNIETAAAYALVVHAVLLLPITLLGALILWRADVSLSQVLRAGARGTSGSLAQDHSVAQAPLSVGAPTAK